MQVENVPRQGDLVAGRYQVGEELGRGGHGVVFRAIQRPLGREVALKMLLPEAVLANGAVPRFLQEASLAQRLEHPNTVRLFDFGQTEHGLPFIVWELLRGRTLDAEIARAPLGAVRTSRVAAQVLKSLMEAHARGIVHRDIKPSNVFLTDFAGESDFVKVLDFGVATTLPFAARGGPALTRDGQIIGTPSYMAPEQVEGGEVSAATDLYALGLVMAEALSGVCVMNGVSPFNVWMAQASPAPVPLPSAVQQSLLRSVIERATRKAPHERYFSAAEMLADVERAMQAATAATDPFAKPLRAMVPTAPITSPPPHAARTDSARTPHAALPIVSAPQTTPLNHAPPFTTPPGHAGYGGHPAEVLPRGSYSASVVTLAQPAAPRGALMATLTMALFAITALSAIVGFLLIRGSSAPASPARERASSAPVVATSTPPNVHAGALVEVTPARTVARIKAEGWTVKDVTPVHLTFGVDVTSIHVARSPDFGAVTIYDYESVSVATQLESRLVNPESAFIRDGGKIVLVEVGHSAVTSKKLLDAIVR